MPSLRLIAIALLAACPAVLPFAAAAEPLEADECKALQQKKQLLLTPQIKSALKRGPDWVKEHLHDYAEIEKVRQYLHVEEKVKFRCRTDGVRIPKPMPPPLPHRKPPVPLIVVEGTPKVLAGVAATAFLPLRKPASPSAETAAAPNPADEESAGEGDITAADDIQAATGPGQAETGSSHAETGPSQTVADSDKTAPSEIKATQ